MTVGSHILEGVNIQIIDRKALRDKIVILISQALHIAMLLSFTCVRMVLFSVEAMLREYHVYHALLLCSEAYSLILSVA